MSAVGTLFLVLAALLLPSTIWAVYIGISAARVSPMIRTLSRIETRCSLVALMTVCSYWACLSAWLAATLTPPELNVVSWTVLGLWVVQLSAFVAGVWLLWWVCVGPHAAFNGDRACTARILARVLRSYAYAWPSKVVVLEKRGVYIFITVGDSDWAVRCPDLVEAPKMLAHVAARFPNSEHDKLTLRRNSGSEHGATFSNSLKDQLREIDDGNKSVEGNA